MRKPLFALLVVGGCSCLMLGSLFAQQGEENKRQRGSIVEDQAARKLLEAGDQRLEADEAAKAVEVWKSVVERYPRSKFRFDAHMRLGKYFLDTERAFDRARVHFEAAAVEDNRDEEQRAEATLRLGVCYYHQRNFGKSFQIMRDVIERFPVSGQVNEAYYYIGLGHYQLGHYSRAIAALEKVGTALSGEKDKSEKLEAGKRFFIRIEDADLAVLDPGESLEVECTTSSGDSEKVKCYPVGRNVRLVLGSVGTKLGQPQVNSGVLEVKGGDTVSVKYTDAHTADRKLNVPVQRSVSVVGNAQVAVTDGAFAETLRGVVLDKPINLRIIDADRDTSDKADSISALVEVYRPKTAEEIETEIASLLAKPKPAGEAAPADAPAVEAGGDEPQVDRFKLIDRATITLTEAIVVDPSAAERDDAPASSTTASAAAGPIHTGVFRATVPLAKIDKVVADDPSLQALPGDIVRVTYQDERHLREGIRVVTAEAKTLEGNIGGVRVTKAVISDEELRVQTQLKTSQALTAIGNRYKEFGLKDKATEKYDQALAVCEEIMDEARKLGGQLLEQTYVQLWNIYFEMDKLDLAAAMCQRLQNEFPNSGFVDDAMLQLGDVARKQGDHNRAIGIYTRLVNMPKSQLRGEAQFGIAECYEAMSAAEMGAAQTQMQDRAFQEYKKVFDQFPESGRVGEAVAKMANHYYNQKDYNRAVDTFETVLANHPDAKFLDVILFNYGRCLFRMGRKEDARARFEQLLGEFPESPLAGDAKKIADALAKAPAAPSEK